MSGMSAYFCRMSVVDLMLCVVAASHVAASISVWSCAIPHQWAMQRATVWSQKVDSGSAECYWDDPFSDRQAVCNIEQLQFDSSAHSALCKADGIMELA
jgi:hypothetical protein